MAWYDDMLSQGQQVADTAQGSGSGAAVGAAAGTWIFPGIGTAAGAVIGQLAETISSLLGGKTLTSWEQQDAVIRPIAEKLATATAANLTADELRFLTGKYLARLTQFIGGAGGNIQPASVQAQYLNAPELVPTSTLQTLLWLGLHFTFHAAPNFSQYEMERRIRPIVAELYAAALGDLEQQYGAGSTAKLKAALFGSSAGDVGAAANMASIVPEGARPVVLGLLALGALAFIFRKYL